MKQQENNITEPGEEEATDSVRIYFNKLKTGDTAKQNYKAYCKMKYKKFLL